MERFGTTACRLLSLCGSGLAEARCIRAASWSHFFNCGLLTGRRARFTPAVFPARTVSSPGGSIALRTQVGSVGSLERLGRCTHFHGRWRAAGDRTCPIVDRRCLVYVLLLWASNRGLSSPWRRSAHGCGRRARFTPAVVPARTVSSPGGSIAVRAQLGSVGSLERLGRCRCSCWGRRCAMRCPTTTPSTSVSGSTTR